MAYAGQATQAPPQSGRPSTLTAIAVLAIAMGALGLLSLPLSILYMATGWKAAGPAGPALWANETFRTYTLVSFPLGTVLSVLYIVAGVGLLRLRPWAWGLTIGLIVFAMLSQVINACVMLPQMGTLLSASMPPMPQGAPDLSFMLPFMYVGVGIGVLIGLAVMTILLVLLTRPNVRGAFRRAGQHP